MAAYTPPPGNAVTLLFGVDPFGSIRVYFPPPGGNVVLLFDGVTPAAPHYSRARFFLAT